MPVRSALSDQELADIQPEKIPELSGVQDTQVYAGLSSVGTLGSLGLGAKEGLIESVEAPYDLAKFLGQKIGLEGAQSNTSFDFHDKAEAEKRLIQLKNPSPTTEFIGNAVAQVGSTALLSLIPGVGEEVLSSRGLEGAAAVARNLNILKSGNKMGFIGRLGSYAALSAPGIVGSSVVYDKKGYAHIDPKQMSINSAIAAGGFGLFEGVGAAFRRMSIQKGSLVDSARDDLKESDGGDKPSILEIAEREKGAVEQGYPVNSEEFINNVIPPEYQARLDEFRNNIDEVPTEGTISRDVRSLNPDRLDDITASAAVELRKADMVLNGVEIDGVKGDITEDPVHRAKAHDLIDKMEAHIGLNGASRVSMTLRLRKEIDSLPLDKQNTVRSIISDTFRRTEYRNAGKLKNPEFKDGWYYTDKNIRGSSETQLSLEPLKSISTDVYKSARALSELSAQGWEKNPWLHVADTMRGVLKSRMSKEEARGIVSDYENKSGIFAKSPFDTSVEEKIKEVTKDHAIKFIDDVDNNPLFVKAVAKLQKKNEAAQEYFSCVLKTLGG